MRSVAVLIQSYALQNATDQYGTFDRRTGEAIALAVGQVDDCTNCQSVHAVDGRAAGLSEEQTAAIRLDRAD